MKDTTAVILCGGAGKRMEGADKPLIERAGRPLLEYILEELEPACAGVVISANRNLETYQQYGKVVTDSAPDRGPLEGIACALENINTPRAFVCPGDAPFVVAEIAKRLIDALDGSTEQIAVAHDGNRRQPLHMVLSPQQAKSIRAYLEAGHRSVYGWLETQALIEVVMEDLAMAFADLDQPGDLD